MTLIFIIGLVLGSFANVLTLRLLQRPLNLWLPSHCPKCKHRLKWFELVPIVSWCLLKGRCKYCNSGISWVYPALEGTVATCFVACFSLADDIFKNCLLSLLSYLFILVIVMDFREKLILNSLNIAIAMGLFCLQIYEQKNIAYVLVSPLVVICISVLLKISFEKFRNLKALGEGDIKLMGALSLGLEVSHLPLWFTFSGGLGLLTGLIWHNIKQEKNFPFGPALIVAFVITYLNIKTSLK
ncbi:MAG: hypothetical protein BGO77_04355 [Caedibacter sp. 37-49]|nr:MAG: hypothetical protein BGO77_04355 [Caedibacter sp. 37-49]